MHESIRFLTTDMVLAIHRRVLDEYGGSEGLRDRGLLESAVAAPAATFGGQLLHEGIPAIAAAYLFHICKNHAFVDGNMRAGLASAIQFLYLNAHHLKAEKDDVEQLTLGVADGSVNKNAATEFFKKHARKSPPVKPASERKPRNPRKRRRS